MTSFFSRHCNNSLSIIQLFILSTNLLQNIFQLLERRNISARSSHVLFCSSVHTFLSSGARKHEHNCTQNHRSFVLSPPTFTRMEVALASFFVHAAAAAGRLIGAAAACVSAASTVHAHSLSFSVESEVLIHSPLISSRNRQ